MKDIIKIVKSIKDSTLLPERVSKTIQNEAKEQRGGFLSIFARYAGCEFTRKYFSRQRNK